MGKIQQRTRYEDATKLRWAQLFVSGKPADDASAEIGVNPSTARHWPDRDSLVKGYIAEQRAALAEAIKQDASDEAVRDLAHIRSRRAAGREAVEALYRRTMEILDTEESASGLRDAATTLKTAQQISRVETGEEVADKLRVAREGKAQTAIQINNGQDVGAAHAGIRAAISGDGGGGGGG